MIHTQCLHHHSKDMIMAPKYNKYVGPPYCQAEMYNSRSFSRKIASFYSSFFAVIFCIDYQAKSQWTSDYLNICQLLSNVLSTTILFAFQQYSSRMHAWYVQHSSTAAAQNSFNFISPELWPQQARVKLNSLRDLGSLYQREYEFQVN